MSSNKDVVVTNARMVLADRIVDGSMVLSDGLIGDIADGSDAITCADAALGQQTVLDAGGDLIIPGLIDLHTDNLERHFQPRAGVTWDGIAASIAHDAQVAACGITTVYDSLTIGAAQGWDTRSEMVEPMIKGLVEARDHAMLRVDHKLHLRCEITHPDLITFFDQHAAQGPVDMVSLMDHAPGDRQSPDVAVYRKRFQKNGMSDLDVERHISALMEKSAIHGPPNMEAIAERARAKSIPLATHDDAKPEHIDLALRMDAVFTEFPTTMEAAVHASAQQLPVLMGSPNLIRGKSHSGNVSAGDLAGCGLLDVLASDYIPASLIKAAFRLTQSPYDWDLPKAIATVTHKPAKCAGLHDRGQLASGLRADFVRVSMVKNWPIVREVWSRGVRVA